MRVLIIHPFLKRPSPKSPSSAVSTYSMSYQCQEATRLAESIQLDVDRVVEIPLNKVLPSTYIGGGKLDEIKDYAEEESIGLVIVNAMITPIQQRNMEKRLNCKVIDRTALILEIFSERAQTKEGRLQVELALQTYQKSRLVRSWTHLERQRGGSGFLGGPGERQIESDRRVIRERITIIKKQLSKVVKRRELHRSSRRKIPYPIVALVGYTNAGKSTLFNALTKASVVAEDKLFATLDPTMRLVTLPSKRSFILSDTVGFISDLPTELVAAFRATLEEVIEADIIVHVRDISDEHSTSQCDDVLSIMNRLVDEQTLEEQTLELYNKVDALTEEQSSNIMLRCQGGGLGRPVAISALKQQGFEVLLERIDQMLGDKELTKEIIVDIKDGKLLAWVYNHTKVMDRHDSDEVITLRCQLSEKEWGHYQTFINC